MVVSMAYELNGKIKNLEPYEPISGEYRIRLDANESFLELPDWLREKLSAALREAEWNRYPDPCALRLCESFAAYYGVKPELVTAGNGSDELISLLVGAFLAAGEELVTLEQDFSMYRFYGGVYGLKTTVLPKNPDLTVDTGSVAAYVRKSGARMLIFSNPCNPTSLCLPRERVLELVRALPDCLVAVDEAYMDFAGESVLGDVERFDNLLLLRTCSKAVGMAAARLGFAVANERLTRALRAVKSPYNVNALSQAAGETVLRETEYLRACTARILESRGELAEGLEELNRETCLFDWIAPTSTNFAYLHTPKAGELWKGLLERSIAVRRMGDCLRITAGAPEENTALLDALREIAAERGARP